MTLRFKNATTGEWCEYDGKCSSCDALRAQVEELKDELELAGNDAIRQGKCIADLEQENKSMARILQWGRCDDSRLAKAYGRIGDLEQQLGDLLAIIHRDGGHHTAKVGTKQSVEDAHKVWAELEQANETIRKLEEAKEEMEILNAQLNKGIILRDDGTYSLVWTAEELAWAREKADELMSVFAEDWERRKKAESTGSPSPDPKE